MISYTIKKKHIDSIIINGFEEPLDFLRQYGYSGRTLMGEILGWYKYQSKRYWKGWFRGSEWLYYNWSIRRE